MSDLFWLTDEQIERLRPFFPGATASLAWTIADLRHRFLMRDAEADVPAALVRHRLIAEAAGVT